MRHILGKWLFIALAIIVFSSCSISAPFIEEGHQNPIVNHPVIINDAPTKTYTEETVIEVALGTKHSVAITSSGRIFTWGDNEYGQLGNGTMKDSSTPIDITSQFNLNEGETFTKINMGYYNSSALTSEGRFFTWGYNGNGELGNGWGDHNPTPTDITSKFNLDASETIEIISVGSHHSAIATSNGRVFAWGDNSTGQLGDGSNSTKSTPIEITKRFNLSRGDKILGLYLNGIHSTAVSSEGRVFTWGANLVGQLGNGTTKDKNKPVEITNLFNLSPEEKIVTLNSGFGHLSAISSNNKIFVWGNNSYGSLGIGTLANQLSPLEITDYFDLTEDETVNCLSLGADYTIALTSANRLFSWGKNTTGQLGDRTTTDKLIPSEISDQFALASGETIARVSSSYWHSAVLTTKGRLFIWGGNDDGQLGIGKKTSFQSTPTEIVIF